MIPALRIYNSSLGRKYLMSLTGLFLCSFLVVHLSGNISLFFHDEGKAFNLYTQFMSHNLLIRLTEFALLGGFVMHIVDAVFLRIKNNAARPQGYAGRPRGAGKGKSSGSFLSRTMIFSGSLILFFFEWGDHIQYVSKLLRFDSTL